jgi:hypothetical protein
MAFRDVPEIKYGLDTLQQMGGQQAGLGAATTAQGVGLLGPVSSYFQNLLSGDPASLMAAIQPEADTVGQQFGQIRQMISQQPRGGGKTSTLAQLPVQHLQTLMNLVSQARNAAPAGLESIARLLSGIGQQETQLGFQAPLDVSQIALEGRQQDIANSWTTFFKNLATAGVQGAGEAFGKGILKHFNLL